MRTKKLFKLGMKQGTVWYCAIYGKTVEEFEQKVNAHLAEGWDLNGDTIYHRGKTGGYTQPLKRTDYK